jgi:hypothetical protein
VKEIKWNTKNIGKSQRKQKRRDGGITMKGWDKQKIKSKMVDLSVILSIII